jgi:3-phenylpropionate/trans-cinnamate dioxygenase ferredoxin reductase subunit
VSSGVVIVGAGLAGASAAFELRRRGYGESITLVGAEPELPYDRPPLSKAALTGEIDLESITLFPQTAYDEAKIEIERGRAVAKLDLRGREVELASGRRLSAEAIVLATGGQPRRLSITGCDLAGVVNLRTWSDAARLSSHLRPGAQVVIVGAGLIGLEVAAAAIRAGAHVVVVEAGSRALPRICAPAIAAEVVAGHVRAGIHFEWNTELRAVRGDGRVRGVELSNGNRLRASCVVVAIGIERSVGLARSAGLACGVAVSTDARMRTSANGVYAIGDVAEPQHPVLGRAYAQEHWRSAQDQAAAAAADIVGTPEPCAATPWFWSDQGGMRLEGGGYPELATQFVLRGEAGSRVLCGLRENRLVSFVALNRGPEAKAALRLIERGAEVDAREIADADTDLRQLLRRPVRERAANGLA